MLGRGVVIERGMRALEVVEPLEAAEPRGLEAQRRGGRARGLLLEGQMQTLVAAVLLRPGRRDALGPHARLDRQNREPRQPAYAPVEANGGPLSERSTAGRPCSRNAASRIGQTWAVSARATAWQRRR